MKKRSKSSKTFRIKININILGMDKKGSMGSTGKLVRKNIKKKIKDLVTKNDTDQGNQMWIMYTIK